MPEAIVIGGANGAGKTTFARELLPALHPFVEFLNVDEIQQESPALAHPIGAGRELLRRVAMRVAAGGHGVPESDVRRRYHRGLALFEQVYKGLVDEWYHWFSDEGGLRLGQHKDR